jgi:alcohol dehydrogenase class IV
VEGKVKIQMNNFIFKCPTKVVFGVNQALNLDSILAPQKWKKIFIVTDKVIEATLPLQAIVEK